MVALCSGYTWCSRQRKCQFPTSHEKKCEADVKRNVKRKTHVFPTYIHLTSHFHIISAYILIFFSKRKNKKLRVYSRKKREFVKRTNFFPKLGTFLPNFAFTFLHIKREAEKITSKMSFKKSDFIFQLQLERTWQKKCEMGYFRCFSVV